MNKSLRTVPALAACIWLATCSCESSSPERESGQMALHSVSMESRGGPPVVAGIVLLATTGKPLEGVILTLPDGTTATSGPDGRFEMVGMRPGLEGLLEARSKDGLVGTNPLLPLAGGRLEVVVRLRKPRGEQ